MNCKPGDLARIIANSKRVVGLTQDALVTVLYLPEVDEDGGCILPDGEWSQAGLSSWVIEFPSPICIKRLSGGLRMTRYATCPDRMLRPIRDHGTDAQDESKAWLPPVPTQHKETA